MKGRKWYSLKKDLRSFITGTLSCSCKNVYINVVSAEVASNLQMAVSTG